MKTQSTPTVSFWESNACWDKTETLRDGEEMSSISERKLASIVKIERIRPIENADKIVVAEVKGWDVIVKVGEFEVGDEAVYFEIDSMLPEKPEYEFLRERKFRIKTIRMRGVLSQGLCLPPTAIPELAGRTDLKEGDDVTSLLGVTKYDPEMSVANMYGSTGRRPFPADVPRTECERVQNVRAKIESNEFANHRFTKTEKVDGCSATFGWSADGSEYFVCSRNYALNEPTENDMADTWWKISKKHDLKEKLRTRTRPGIFIQGEIIGHGINGNAYRAPVLQFYLFAVFDTVRQVYLGIDELKTVAHELDLKHVPIVDENARIENTTVKELLKDADNGKSIVNDKAVLEGYVYASAETCNLNRRRIIKVISNAYLLKKKE